MFIHLQSDKKVSLTRFLRGLLMGLFMLQASPGLSPPMTMEEDEFLYVTRYIQTCHRDTSALLEAFGQSKPPDLRRSRAEYYAKVLLRAVAKYENPRELLYLYILPQTRNGSGWVNRRFDLDKKHKSHGIFEFQERTGQGVAAYTPGYEHLARNHGPWWKRHLILNVVMQIELGTSMSDRYRNDYGHHKYTFTAVIAGPGTMSNVEKKYAKLSEKDKRTNKSKLDQVLSYAKETAARLQLMREVYGATAVRRFRIDKDWAVARHHDPRPGIQIASHYGAHIGHAGDTGTWV